VVIIRDPKATREIAFNIKRLDITNATRNAVLSGRANNSELRFIVRIMKYKIDGNTTVST